MANDIFGYIRNDPKQVFSADLAKMSISGTAGDKSVENYLVQSWTLTYRHEVQELYEIGSSNLYWVKGHPIGDGTLGRIVGTATENSDSVKFFSKGAYDMCTGGETFTIKLTPGICLSPSGSTNQETVAQGVTLALNGCVVTQIGFTINAQDVKISEEIRIRFAALTL